MELNNEKIMQLFRSDRFRTKLKRLIESELQEKTAVDFTIERRKLTEPERMHQIVEEHMSRKGYMHGTGIVSGVGAGILAHNTLSHRIKHPKLKYLPVTAAVLLGRGIGRTLSDRSVDRRIRKLENPNAKHWIIKRAAAGVAPTSGGDEGLPMENTSTLGQRRIFRDEIENFDNRRRSIRTSPLSKHQISSLLADQVGATEREFRGRLITGANGLEGTARL